MYFTQWPLEHIIKSLQLAFWNYWMPQQTGASINYGSWKLGVDLAGSETDSDDDFCGPLQMGWEHSCFNLRFWCGA